MIGRWLFRRFLRSAQPTLAADLGDRCAKLIVGDATGRYEATKAGVPYIGGYRNVFTPVMAINVWLVALHRSVLAHGGSAENTIRASQQVADRWIARLPGFVLRAEGRLLMSRPSRWYLRRQAARSQERRYPADFVWSAVESDDGEASLLFDECAVNKYYEAEGLQDLAPYCNFFDVTYSRLMNMGVDASHTIGLGCDQCALRYKHGRTTVVPVRLRSVIRS